MPQMPFRAEPELKYPETTAFKSTRPSGRGPQRQVFVAGVERAATLYKLNRPQ
jgi:hypothetical protein